ncbi:hypothetical protein AB3S75_041796 [Citrus x aurantiifolia]
MAKLSTSIKKNNGIKIVVKKIQKSLLLGKKKILLADECEEIEDSSTNNVPEDVKEGHVAVLAMDGNDQAKRFIVPLNYLSHPTFMSLLEQAAEEYGFDRGGALTVPCQPSELEKILAEQGDDDGSSVNVKWRSCNPIVQSC